MSTILATSPFKEYWNNRLTEMYIMLNNPEEYNLSEDDQEQMEQDVAAIATYLHGNVTVDRDAICKQVTTQLELNLEPTNE